MTRTRDARVDDALEIVLNAVDPERTLPKSTVGRIVAALQGLHDDADAEGHSAGYAEGALDVEEERLYNEAHTYETPEAGTWRCRLAAAGIDGTVRAESDSLDGLTIIVSLSELEAERVLLGRVS